MPDPPEYRNPYTERPAGPPPPPPPPSYRTPPPGQPWDRTPPAGGPGVTPASTTTTVGAPPAASRSRQLLWIALVIVDLFLALHFIFFLTAAGDVGFGHLVYVVGDALNAPFRGLFNISVTHSGHKLQWADVVAVAIYTIVAWIVDRVIVIMTTPSPRRGTPPPP